MSGHRVASRQGYPKRFRQCRCAAYRADTLAARRHYGYRSWVGVAITALPADQKVDSWQALLDPATEHFPDWAVKDEIASAV